MSTPIMPAFGTNSCSSSNFFGSNAVVNRLTPVALPPGRLKLATTPSWTGSPAETKTIGIVVVAAFVARTLGVLPAKITATWRRTNSAASAGSRPT